MSRITILVAGLCAVALAGVGSDVVGRIDTVGGTTYDWQFTGPVPAWVYCDPGYGIHVVWAYSAEMSGTTFPDRNLRYNFYSFTASDWNWLDPDYMVSGVNIFTERTGPGSFDVNPVTHCVLAGTHVQGSSGLDPILARDAAPGGGIFDYSNGAPTCSSLVYPRISVSSTGKIHVALTDMESMGKLYYSGIEPWPAWSAPFHVPPPLPDPGYPAYAIAASRHQPHVCIMWAVVDSEPRRIYYRQSTDDGQTWLAPDSLPMPPAFHPGSDTVPSVGTNDLYPWYDPDDDPETDDGDISVAAAFYPVVQGQGMVVPAEIWHWRTSSGWSHIARAECDTAHMQGGIGYNALYASRPSLGRCAATNQLICVWEQFDSANVEPRTDLLRADIWAVRGDSTGATWGVPVRLTDPDNTSKRFPSVAGWAMGDTFVVSYMVDGCAGFAGYGQGPATQNPLAVQYVCIESLPQPNGGVEETPSAEVRTANCGPTIAHDVLFLPASGEGRTARGELLDIAGRNVLDLKPGPNDVRSLAPGVYFIRAVSRKPSAISYHKIVVQR